MFFLLGNPRWGQTILLYMAASAIDALFWSLLLAPVLYLALPILALWLQLDEGARKTVDQDGVLRVLKRWTDSTTIPLWLLGVPFGLNLVTDESLPLLIMFQWMVLPYNNVLGLFTIVPFLPVTLYCIYITQKLDYLIYSASDDEIQESMDNGAWY